MGRFWTRSGAWAKPGRVCHAGEEEWFFDDTEIEVYGDSFEGARIHYNGDRALSLQTLWRGPFVVDAILDGASDVSEHCPRCWTTRSSMERAADALLRRQRLECREVLGLDPRAQFTHWSVSYNK